LEFLRISSQALSTGRSLRVGLFAVSPEKIGRMPLPSLTQRRIFGKKPYG